MKPTRSPSTVIRSLAMHPPRSGASCRICTLGIFNTLVMSSFATLSSSSDSRMDPITLPPVLSASALSQYAEIMTRPDGAIACPLIDT